MAKPTAEDPLGLCPDPGSFADQMEKFVDARIDQRWAGRTSDRFNGAPDAQIVLELIARGYAVYKPTGNT